MLSVNLSDSDINNLLETLIDDPDGNLIQIESCREKIKNVLKEAVNEQIDRLFVEPNKHIGEHHKQALHAICADYQHLCNSL